MNMNEMNVLVSLRPLIYRLKSSKIEDGKDARGRPLPAEGSCTHLVRKRLMRQQVLGLINGSRLFNKYILYKV